MAGTASSGGRNRKSAEQHRLEGTFQRVRHEGHGAPEPPRGVPAPPRELAGDVLAEWTRMVERLQASGTLSVVDDAALFQYASLWAETEAIAAASAETRRVIAEAETRMIDMEGSEYGEALKALVSLRQIEAKYLVQVRQGRMALRQYLVEFGMTPSARSRVKVPDGKKPSDPFAEFDGGGVQ